jgi:hypothetical protein
MNTVSWKPNDPFDEYVVVARFIRRGAIEDDWLIVAKFSIRDEGSQ